MSLIKNKDSGNFYPKEIKEVGWKCDWLWSSHRGCTFDCSYCSSKRLNVRFGGDSCEIRRLKGEWMGVDASGHLKRYILPNAKIFISPYNDIMTVNKDDRSAIFGAIYDTTEYWFDRDAVGHKEKSNFGIIMQTKDPAKYFDYLDLIPEGSWLGTTIETDDLDLYPNLSISKAPNLANRWHNMIKLKVENENFKYFVTIEPIINLIGNRLTFYMKALEPDLVFIGANTSKIQLPEPFADDIMQLVIDLSKFTKVYLKSNIKRLIPTYFYNQWKDGLFEKEIQ